MGILWYCTIENTITISVVILATIFTLTPDLDLKFKQFKHRSLLTHSILIPCLGFYGDFGLLECLMVLSVGLHCLEDIRIIPVEKDKDKRIGFKKVGGTYCLFLINGRLNYWASTLWLFINFLLSVIIFGVMMWWGVNVTGVITWTWRIF